MRYYVYSLDSGHPPNDPLHEGDDLLACQRICDANSLKHNATTYVVDREKRRFQEVYARIGGKFAEMYLENKEALEKLKNGEVVKGWKEKVIKEFETED
jgi:hypothetical protein